MLKFLAACSLFLVMVRTQNRILPDNFRPGGVNNVPDFGLLSDEEIEYVNTVAQTTWTAGRNFHHKDQDYVKRLLGSEMSENSTKTLIQIRIKHFDDSLKVEDLPVNFDPRTHWPHCPSLWEVRDQGDCGSCWDFNYDYSDIAITGNLSVLSPPSSVDRFAFAAVGSMTDRLCIQTQGMQQFHFSAEHVLSCCKTCGKGCGGGFPSRAWDFYRDEGVVSGGPYNSSEGCQPYKIPACDHHVIGHLQPCTLISKQTPRCRKKCRRGFEKKFSDDKRYGKNVYTVRGEENIMRELVTNGPVGASFKVYSDFYLYKSGVYQHTSGAQPHGGHAVKLIGYGVENGTKYWLLVNSWNPDWGDGGFFKVLRGENECEIEQHICAGDPSL